MIKLIKSTFYREAEAKRELCQFIRRADKLSIGDECQRFEHAYARYHKRKHCVLVNSGSSANLAIVQALMNVGKLKKGDPVGFSAVTWATNVMPLIQLGLTPVPVDIDLGTLNVTSRTLGETFKKTKLKMMFLTNLLGFCGDIDAVADLCARNKTILVEDNCESFGTVYKKRLLGTFGYASTHSFYVGHHLSMIEGGAVLTDSSELDTMLQFVRAHGWDRNLTEKRQLRIRNKYNVNSSFYSRYTFYDLGYNFRSTEINGFLGNHQLRYADEIVQRREQNFRYLAERIFARTDLYYPISYGHLDRLSNFAVPIICRTQKLRDELVKRCEGKVEIRPVVGGDMTSQPFYPKYRGTLPDRFVPTNARIAHAQGMYFGNNPELTKKELDELVRIFTAL